MAVSKYICIPETEYKAKFALEEEDGHTSKISPLLRTLALNSVNPTDTPQAQVILNTLEKDGSFEVTPEGEIVFNKQKLKGVYLWNLLISYFKGDEKAPGQSDLARILGKPSVPETGKGRKDYIRDLSSSRAVTSHIQPNGAAESWDQIDKAPTAPKSGRSYPDVSLDDKKTFKETSATKTAAPIRATRGTTRGRASRRKEGAGTGWVPL